MTLKTIAADVARNMGLQEPDTIVGNSNDDDAVKILQFITEAGEELARRVDWGKLQKSHLLLGTGFAALYDLPADYARMSEGYSVSFGEDRDVIRGGLTKDEWNSLKTVEGQPRYYYIEGDRIGFYPYPAESDQITLAYISKNWVSGQREYSSDQDSSLVPERLLALGAIWRFKRHMEADYSDYLAEYEAMLTDLAGDDVMVRQP